MNGVSMLNMLVAPQWALLTLAWINFVVCAAIVCACLCRIFKMSATTTKLSFRAGYTMMLVASVASGLSPVLFGEWPGPGQLLMGLVAAFVIGVGVRKWRDGVPDYARRSTMDD